MSNLIKPLIISSLQELADYNFQRRVWLATAGPEISSFTEAVSGLFDDSGVGNALEQHSLVFSTGIDSLFRNLRKELQQIDHTRPPAAIISDPCMDRVRTIAADLLSLLTGAR